MTPNSRITVLVVNDDALALSLALYRHGHNVITADSGNQALRLFELWPDLEIDLALVDLLMCSLGIYTRGDWRSTLNRSRWTWGMENG